MKMNEHQSLKQPTGLNKTEAAAWAEAARLFSDPAASRDLRDRAWCAYLDTKRVRDQRIFRLWQWLSHHRIDEEMPADLLAELKLLREGPEVRRMATLNTLCSHSAPVDERAGRTRLAYLLCVGDGSDVASRGDLVFLQDVGEWIERLIERGDLTASSRSTVAAMPPDMKERFLSLRASVESRLSSAAAALSLLLRLDPARPARGLRHFVYLLLATLPATL